MPTRLPPRRPQARSYPLGRAGLGSLLAAGLVGCASPTLRPSPGEATLTDAALQQRGKALEALAVTALLPCAAKLAADERGVFVVLGKPDGSLDLGPLQWLGNAASQKCITEEAVKARLPAYNGPTVTWLWSVGSAAHPAPGPLTAPAGYPDHLATQTRAVQGQGSVGVPLAQSPLAACPLRNPAPDAFASLVARLFVFPDGRVAGATPIATAYDGQDAAFLDCAMELVRAWRFPAFTGPGFVVVDAPLRRGIDPRK
jgi:hypothetical protein